MVMERLNRFCKAYLHEGLEKLEDPVVMVKQYMRDMKADIGKQQATIEKHLRLEETLKRNWQTAKELVERREQQARLAVEKENDELAKMALKSKKEAWEQMNRFAALREKNELQIEAQKQTLAELEQKYNQLRDRKLELVLRVQAVKASEQIKDTKRKYRQQESIIENEFERMEDKVTDLEWKSGGRPAVVSDLPDVDDEELQAELEQLKQQANQ